MAQRVVQRGWCRKRMQPRWVPVSTWGRNSTRGRTNQQREEQQQKRTAGGKVSPRETLPPESVMGAAQHRTLGAAPRRASGRERAPAARPLVVKVDHADAAESPRHPENVPRLHLQHARRQVPLFGRPPGGRRDGRRDGLGGRPPLSRRHRPTGAAGTQRWCAALECAAWQAAEPRTCPQEGAGQGGLEGLPRARPSRRGPPKAPHPRPQLSTRARLATTQRPTPP